MGSVSNQFLGELLQSSRICEDAFEQLSEKMHNNPQNEEEEHLRNMAHIFQEANNRNESFIEQYSQIQLKTSINHIQSLQKLVDVHQFLQENQLDFLKKQLDLIQKENAHLRSMKLDEEYMLSEEIHAGREVIEKQNLFIQKIILHLLDQNTNQPKEPVHEISLNKLKEKKFKAYEVLMICSYFNPSQIHTSLFDNFLENEQITEILLTDLTANFIHFKKEENCFSIDSALIKFLQKEQNNEWFSKAIGLLIARLKQFDKNKQETYQVGNYCEPHLKYLNEYFEKLNIYDQSFSELLLLIGIWKQFSQNQVPNKIGASFYYSQSLELRKKIHGDQHIDVAECFYYQGIYNYEFANYYKNQWGKEFLIPLDSKIIGAMKPGLIALNVTAAKEDLNNSQKIYRFCRPDSYEVLRGLIALANVHFLDSNYVQALIDYEQALRIPVIDSFPAEKFEALAQKGVCLCSTEKVTDAILTFKEAFIFGCTFFKKEHPALDLMLDGIKGLLEHEKNILSLKPQFDAMMVEAQKKFSDNHLYIQKIREIIQYKAEGCLIM